MAMRIGVTGGTGFIGKAIVEEALNRTIDVLSLQRDPENARCEAIRFDLMSPESLQCDDIRGLDVVIHTAALVHKPDDDESRHLSVNYEATKILFEKCVEAGVKRFIFLSTVGVYGLSSAQKVLTVDSALNPDSSYAKAKLLSEKFLLENNGPVSTVILRLPLVYGEHAPGNYGLITKLARRKIPLPFWGVCNKRSMISVENVARVINDLLESKIMASGVELVAEEGSFSTQAIIKSERAKVGVAAWLFPCPKFAIKFFLKTVGKTKIYEQLYEDLQFESTLSAPYLVSK